MRSWMPRALLLACFASPTAIAQAQHHPAYPPTSSPVFGSVYNPVPAPVQTPLAAPTTYIDSNVSNLDSAAFTLTPEGERFSLRGWVDGGYVYNDGQPNSHFNGPYNSVPRANEGMFNQVYVIGEFLLPQDGSFGVGGRVDALYGMDYFVAQSVGFELNENGTRRWNSNQYYGVAVPQLYGQVGTNDHNVKVGHFYTIVGYESVQAASNFFYSKAYSYQFSQPYTHWGALASSNVTDNLQLQAGVHAGWNTLDAEQDYASFIGGYKYTSCEKNWWSSLAVTTGQEFNNVAGLGGVNDQYANRTRYSFIVDANLTENIEYVFHHWLGFQLDGRPGGGTALWYGIDQYAYYKINECLKVGSRFEWFRDEDGTRVGLTLPNNPNFAPLPGSYYSATFGFNYSPVCNLVIRPEARWDFATDTVGRPYNDGTSNNQFMLAIDVILKF